MISTQTHGAAAPTVKLTKRLVAFVQKHPRGHYWVRDASFTLPLGREEEDSVDVDRGGFVAFFTGDLDQPIWLYPGDELAAGRPYGRPRVIGPVVEPLTPKDHKTVRMLDEHLARMWAARAPGGPLTRVRAFGRVSTCPGTPEAVETALKAAGFEVMSVHCTRRRGRTVDERFLDVMSEEDVRFMRDLTSVMM